jgi:choline-glycine betaine transporter
LFGLLHHFPLSSVTTILVVVLVAIFFVSGADAASIVMGTLSERGAIEPRKSIVVFWGVLTGAVAAVMLLVGGGGSEALQGLQNLTIVAALPFALVMVGLAVALTKDLRSDPLMLRKEIGAEAVEAAVIEGVSAHGDDFALVVTGSDSTSDVPESPQPRGEAPPPKP